MLFGLTLTFLASQFFAGIALLLSILSFQFKERKRIILCLIFAAICIFSQFILLERYVAAAIVCVGLARYFTSYYYPRLYLVPLFILSFGILTCVFWKDAYDVLPFLSASINTIGAFQRNDKYLRIIMLFGAPLLILYYFLIGSPVGILLETLFLGSNILGYWRYYIRKK